MSLDVEASNGTTKQFHGSPHTIRSLHDNDPLSSLPPDQGFDLNTMTLDHFYPWTLENAMELSNFPSNLNGYAT